jgi:hypothetical protein
VTEVVLPPAPLFAGSLSQLVTEPSSLNTGACEPGVTPLAPCTRVIGETSAFKTSTGVELRFFMPVLNVPFRLIYAWNPQRVGVLDNNLQPAKDKVFRFAVGTTF